MRNFSKPKIYDAFEIIIELIFQKKWQNFNSRRLLQESTNSNF